MEQPDALVLTAIGIGTAFGVLVMLLVTVLLIRLISWAIDRYFGDDDTPDEPADALDPPIPSPARTQRTGTARGRRPSRSPRS